MKLLPLAAAVLGFACLVPGAQATVQRTFVASSGVDTNPCSLAQPCRTFAAALLQTSSGGEIVVLDSAGYGGVTIAQSVSITAPPGIYAGITVASGPGITIDAPNILVYLRGLTLNGQPGGTDGIVYTRAGRVVVDHCQINRMPGRSIVATASVGTLLVRDTTVSGSGSPAIDLPGTVTVNLDRVTVDTTSGGPAVYIIGGADVSINDSSIVRNFGRGVEIFAQGGATARLAVAKSLVAQNGDAGIAAGTDTSGAKYYLNVSDSTVFRNNFGIYASTYSGGQGTATIIGNTISENGSGSGVGANGGGSTTVVLAGNAITRNYNGIDNIGATIRTPANNNVAQNTNADVIGTALTPLVQK